MENALHQSFPDIAPGVTVRSYLLDQKVGNGIRPRESWFLTSRVRKSHKLRVKGR